MEHSAKQIRRAAVGLALLAALLVLPDLGGRPATRQQELRVLLCARTMAEGGSWLIPEFQGQPRLRKPPLMYWVTALPTMVSDTPGAARLPGALAGIALVVVTFLLGCLTLKAGPPAACIGAFVLATSRLFLKQAPSAETDALLCLCVTGAVLVGWRIGQHPKPPWRWWLAWGALVGLGFLTKGPAALVLPVVGLLLAPPAQPRPNIPRALGGFGIALALALAIALPWYIYIRTGISGSTAVVGQELTDTFAKATHPGPPWYYLYTLPKTLLPWGILVPFALVGLWKKRNALTDGERFLWRWLAAGFLLLTLTPQKQEHYALLLLPVAALLTGALIHRPNSRELFKTWRNEHPALNLALMGAIIIGLFLAIAFTAFLKSISSDRQIVQLLSHFRDEVQSAEHVHVVGINSAIFEYYLHRPVENLDDPVHAWRRAQPGEHIFWVGTGDAFSSFADRIPHQPEEYKHWQGENYRRGFVWKKQ